ncbi:MAG TPA: polysaccharide deacetylase family protein [Terriglobales bacterium]|nr:polysaccharide deacetylase family protein [Terriglobales bacterium]
MKRLVKAAFFIFLYYSGIERLLARLIRPNAIAVLMYHGVCDRAVLPPEINFHLPPCEFEQQMRALKSRYEVVPLDDVCKSLAEGKPLQKSVVITFDDGYRNNFSYAAPVLKRLGLPYTVYVATSFVDSDHWIPLNEVYWLWSEGKLDSVSMREARTQIRTSASETLVPLVARAERPSVVSKAAEDSFAMLKWKELETMARDGANFGSHTHTHCNMAVQSDQTQKRELLISKQLLESHLGTPITSFAYPYGRREQMSSSARKNIVQSGYLCALSAEQGLVTAESDRFSLPRIGYERPIWRFTGELLYQFIKQAWKEWTT